MSGFGWLLFVLGTLAVVVGFLQRRKLSRINAVPFRAPSEIARMGAAAGDARAMVSTEGSVIVSQPMVGPMSGQPCLGFEVTIERKWEKEEKNSDGSVSTRSGKDVLFKKYEGSHFQVSDGQGAVWVDATKQPDATLEPSYSNAERVGLIAPAAMAFGSMQFQLPMLPRDSRTTAIVGTEKLLKPSGTLYALGGIEATPNGTVITTPKGMTTGGLTLSHQGRAVLVHQTQRNMRLALGFGAGLAVIGLPMGLFAPHAAARPTPSYPAASFSNATRAPLTGLPAPTHAATPNSTEPLALGELAHGVLADADPSQPLQARTGNGYTLELTAGQPVTIFTRGGMVTHGVPGSHLDVIGTLLHDGVQVARDDDGGGHFDSRIAYTPLASGTYVLQVTGFVGTGGAYTVQALPGTLQTEHGSVQPTARRHRR